MTLDLINQGGLLKSTKEKSPVNLSIYVSVSAMLVYILIK